MELIFFTTYYSIYTIMGVTRIHKAPEHSNYKFQWLKYGYTCTILNNSHDSARYCSIKLLNYYSPLKGTMFLYLSGPLSWGCWGCYGYSYAYAYNVMFAIKEVTRISRLMYTLVKPCSVIAVCLMPYNIFKRKLQKCNTIIFK